jgi:hypothetical protein
MRDDRFKGGIRRFQQCCKVRQPVREQAPATELFKDALWWGRAFRERVAAVGVGNGCSRNLEVSKQRRKRE